MREDGLGFEARISGAFEIPVRSGVAPVLRGLGNDLDLRIRGICNNGGEYGGFMAPIEGGDYEQENSDDNSPSKH
jgi:hypothetical protein